MIMRKILGRLSIFLFFVATSSFGQELIPVFPSANATIQFSSLMTRGFEWGSPAGAQAFLIRIRGPIDNLIIQQQLQTGLQAISSPYTLPANFQLYFANGAYEWQVEIASGEGAGTQSDWIPFTIGAGVNIRPTPTPINPVPPSGDLDGSLKIDSRDIFLFSHFWKFPMGDAVSPLDLNVDGHIDKSDILIYFDRFGQTVSESSMLPAVGVPRDIRYEPAQVIHMSQSGELVIHWSPPAYPSDTSFLYDVLILTPYSGNEILGIDLVTESFKPFDFMTENGDYTVYIRAKDASGRAGNIISSSFTLGYTQPIATSTPTPRPQNADLSGDNSVDSMDLMSFADFFGNSSRDQNYNAQPDFLPDGIIDINDLLIFNAIFSRRSQLLKAPVWQYADVPVLEMVGFTPEEVGRTQVDFPPNEMYFGQNNPSLKFAEFNKSIIYFSEVEGAVDYQVKIRSEIYGDSFQIYPGREFYTDGSNFIEDMARTEPDILQIQVRAVGENSRLGTASETLRVIISD